MLSSFFLNAILGGVAVAIVAGILGSVVLWKRMAYFGDALSHSSLLGITLGVLFGLNLTVSVIIFAIFFVLTFIKKKNSFSSDTSLGIIAYTSLSLAIAISSIANIKIDLMEYFFGDILVINDLDIGLLLLTMLITIIWLYYNWSNIILLCISEELLQSEGVNTDKLSLSFTLILALFIAISFKIVGMLLVTAILIIPSAAAFNISASPMQMICFSIIIGVLSVVGGIGFAIISNCPTGVAIIITSFSCLLFSTLIKTLRTKLVF